MYGKCKTISLRINELHKNSWLDANKIPTEFEICVRAIVPFSGNGVSVLLATIRIKGEFFH